MRKNSKFKEGLIYYKIGRRRVLDISIRLGGWLDSTPFMPKERIEANGAVSVSTPMEELLQFAFDVNREIVHVVAIIMLHLLMIKCILHKSRTWVT